MTPINALRSPCSGSMAAAACAWAPPLLPTTSAARSMGRRPAVDRQHPRPKRRRDPLSADRLAVGGHRHQPAAAGGVPVIPGFAANAGAQSYPVLWVWPAPRGINLRAARGRFGHRQDLFRRDRRRPEPVSYVVDGQQVANWVQPPPRRWCRAGVHTPAGGNPGASDRAGDGCSGRPGTGGGSSGTPHLRRVEAPVPHRPPLEAQAPRCPLEGSTASTAPSAAAATPSTAAAPASTPSTAAASPAPAVLHPRPRRAARPRHRPPPPRRPRRRAKTPNAPAFANDIDSHGLSGGDAGCWPRKRSRDRGERRRSRQLV